MGGDHREGGGENCLGLWLWVTPGTAVGVQLSFLQHHVEALQEVSR